MPLAPVVPLTPAVPQRTCSGVVVVAVVGQKGGVAKTTLAVGLAASLARAGRRVLLVDLDPQGSATVALGIAPGRSIAHALIEGAPITTALVEARSGLSLVPGDVSVAQLEPWLYGAPEARLGALRAALGNVADLFDVVILDTAPGVSMVNALGYVAADGLIVPCAPDGLSLHGVRGVEAARARLDAAGHPAPPVVLAVPTLADRRHGRTALVEEALRLHFGDRVGPPLRVCSALAVAMANGRTIYEHAPRSPAAADLDALTARLLDVLGTLGTTGTAGAKGTSDTIGTSEEEVRA